ncbi:hypothetical protein P3T76_012072 [Phytophthora citrophthora]|uniref:Uncharacterized protein n=1 Tax=Phytophthora citrophthora TaxID=4793 RepID=A0AAD9G608_9STRA|nr:hypothetical protein P3T76_012072 [Phytophthora citrophthora]
MRKTLNHWHLVEEVVEVVVSPVQEDNIIERPSMRRRTRFSWKMGPESGDSVTEIDMSLSICRGRCPATFDHCPRSEKAASSSIFKHKGFVG